MPDADRRRANAADRDLKTLNAVRDRIRGVYALPSNPNGLLVRAGRIARNLNYLRLMGGVTISSIPDLGRPVMEYGLVRTFRDGWIPFIAGFKDIRPIARREAQLAGTAIDMALDSRALSIADLMDDYGRTSKFERAIHGMSSNFGLVSLMAPWTDAMQQVTSLIAMNGMLHTAGAASRGTAASREIGKLATSGIDQPMTKRIWSEFSREGRGDTVRELRLPNPEAWADRGAIEAFRGALVREVDRVIIKPVQDKPLWMSTELGKLVGQFKGFAVASTQRILLAGLQQRDAHALSGLPMMVGLAPPPTASDPLPMAGMCRTILYLGDRGHRPLGRARLADGGKRHLGAAVARSCRSVGAHRRICQPLSVAQNLRSSRRSDRRSRRRRGADIGRRRRRRRRPACHRPASRAADGAIQQSLLVEHGARSCRARPCGCLQLAGAPMTRLDWTRGRRSGGYSIELAIPAFHAERDPARWCSA
ncbi:hypothetical protein J2X65_004712 [Ancylobacter sp. 3268]|uniref:hypothetical protein n=1 Tax=Ancylobacter sp. 3268 TaxID=2817752 RepID=UPI002861AF75|nr:hypothetical protein [Ancylobacter sp. 3268]MDR6955333.1 hypothetical protein [Ancylobacter sp. 3268]